MENMGFTTAQQMPVPINNRLIPTVPSINTYINGAIPSPVQVLPTSPSSYVPTNYVIRYCIPAYPTAYTVPQSSGCRQPQVVNIPPGTNYTPISGYNVTINSINSNGGSNPASTPVSASQSSSSATAASTATATASAPPPPPAQPVQLPPVSDKASRPVTPLTPELINKLNNSLSKGSKDDRLNAVGTTLKLLREDPEGRKNNPALVGLINKSLNEVQPSEVKTAAIIACEDGLVTNNPRTQQLLQALSLKPDGLDTNTLASTALSSMQGGG